MEQFDVIVIGGGSAGENIAGRCEDRGSSIAVIESDLVGGECSYWACIPSKVLLRPGEVLAEVRRVPGASAAVTGELDVDAVLRRRDEIVGNWDDEGQVKWLERAGATLIRGHARLAGERRVDVELPGGQVRELEARLAVVLATGSSAVIPPIESLSDITVWDSRRATSSQHVPERLVVLGGGVVGVEMAQAWKRLGAREVTVVEGDERLVGNLEPFAGDELRALLTHMGKYQARIAADVILNEASLEAWADHRAVPSVVFTDPQLATVGLTERAAREQGIDVRVVHYPTGDVSGAKVHGLDISGTSQLVVDEARRVIVGATFTGPGVGEMLHAATIAIACEVPLDVLGHAVPTFPTVSEVWLRPWRPWFDVADRQGVQPLGSRATRSL